MQLPIDKRIGVYGAHQMIYAACGGGRPVWRRFDDHAIVLTEQPSSQYTSKPYDPCPKTGVRLRFNLLAEISKANGKPEQGGRAKRIDPILTDWIQSEYKKSWQELTYQHGVQWLQSREQRFGYEIEEIAYAEYAPLEFKQIERFIRIGTVNYTGVLKVAQSDYFKNALINGMGRGKAWGCGLLMCKKM